MDPPWRDYPTVLRALPSHSRLKQSLVPQAVSATVVDPDGAVIGKCESDAFSAGQPRQAHRLPRRLRKEKRFLMATGILFFSDVTPGPFQLSFTASSFAPLEKAGVVHAGEDLVFFADHARGRA